MIILIVIVIVTHTGPGAHPRAQTHPRSNVGVLASIRLHLSPALDEAVAYGKHIQ